MKIALAVLLAYLCSFSLEQDKPEVAFVSFVLAGFFAIWSIIEMHQD
jgi:hypothetical protein